MEHLISPCLAMRQDSFPEIPNGELKKLFDSNYKFKNIDYLVHNFVKSSVKQKFDGIFALDVLEHIKRKDEKNFILNLESFLCLIIFP